MKQLFLLFACCTLLSFRSFAQCHVDTIPDAYNQGGQCYINGLSVDANTISSNSGFTTAGPSYQSFNNPYVLLQQGQQHWFGLDIAHSSFYSFYIWIDYNNDSVYSSTEIVLWDPNTNSPSVYAPIGVPSNVLPDTVHMRITVQQNATGWGPGADDACEAPGIGETEDYLVIIQCASVQSLSFDPYPSVCHADSIQLTAYSANMIAWYTGSPMTLQTVSSSSGFYLHTSPNTTDTTVYLEFASPGCFSGWIDSMVITVMPSPVADILSPDTVQSCGPVTISAVPGPHYYSWNTGDTGSTINITTGFGGTLQLGVTSSNGCSSFDQIWTHIAPLPPANYATANPGSWFCQNLELYLNYDSLIAPGTCAWYTYPGNTFIGSGSQVIYNLPDTGVYQLMAIVNSVCGTDTIIRTVNGYINSTYDSVYVVDATQDISGTYVLCYSGSGTFTTIAAGVNGTIEEWLLTDVTLGFGMSWQDDDTLELPSNMAVVGHTYSAQAVIVNPMGCYDTTELVMLTPANTINFNMPDTSWACSFPHWIGQGSPNYAVYDILWNTGDTSVPINVSAMGTYTLYTIDHATGCSMRDTTVVWDQTLNANVFPDTTISCSGQAYFDLMMLGYDPFAWEEYDTGWNMINTVFGNYDYTAYDQGNPVYLVAIAQTSAGCMFSDTTYIDYNGQFTFSLGPDVTTMTSPYLITAPAGYPYYTWMPANVSTQNISVNSTGTYTLTIMNGQGCTWSDTITVNILPTSVTDPVQPAIALYPNPAAEQVTVNTTVAIQSISVYDAEGRRVQTENAGRATMHTMHTGELGAGIYIMEVVTTEGIIRSRLVIQR
jgi:hypothetical protein